MTSENTNGVDKNTSNFSENYVMEKKKELAMNLLSLFNITNLEEKKCINFNDLNDKDNLINMKEMIPALKTVFQISKNRSLSISSWDRTKHPGVNLVRQILKEINYKLMLINEFQGTYVEDDNTKKIYNTKYMIVPLDIKNKHERKQQLAIIMEEKKKKDNISVKTEKKNVIVKFN